MDAHSNLEINQDKNLHNARILQSGGFFYQTIEILEDLL